MAAISGHFYVQDVRYVTITGCEGVTICLTVFMHPWQLLHALL